MTVPDPFPLRSEPIPPEIAGVEGCDCGGGAWHRAASYDHPGCSIWSLPAEQRRAAVDAADERVTAYIDGLNARLRQYGERC